MKSIKTKFIALSLSTSFLIAVVAITIALLVDGLSIGITALICYGAVFVIMAISFVIISKTSDKIIKPLESASERLKSLADGNLTDPVSIPDSNDELYELTNALQETVSSLRVYITKITDALVNISEGNLTDRVHGSFHGDFIKLKVHSIQFLHL